jgi:dCMP deaminase
MTDIDLLRAACQIARRESDDPRTQNAAVLVQRSGPKITGSVWSANRFPRGVRRAQEPPEKYDRIEHAERAAIFAAARAGWRTAGATMYTPWFACCDCARAIVAAGVVEVVGSAKVCAATPERWRRAVLAGEAILREAGVGMRWLAEPLGVGILFDGKEVTL